MISPTLGVKFGLFTLFVNFGCKKKAQLVFEITLFE